ncbi:hypothetical protein MK338_07155, partial [Streptococcus vestibularis]|nr:hypothetical protein [Streptococcus vestibularis]
IGYHNNPHLKPGQ